MALVHGPVDGDVAAFVCARARPGSRPGASDVSGLLSSAWRPPSKRGELARTADRDGAGRLAAVLAQMRPTGAHAALRAPGDLNDARVLVGLAGRELSADARAASVVVGGLGQQPPRARRAGLGGRARARLLSEVYSDGTIARNPDNSAGLANRSKLPTSAHTPAVESGSIPRKQRNRATVLAWLLAGPASSSSPISVRRRCPSASTAQQ
jgi:hypothetical protein